jgi:hypothetical protein
MLMRQERERRHPITEGSFLSSERLHFLRRSDANVRTRLLRSRIPDPEMEAFFHLEPVMAAIGVMISFCTVWLLTVFVLYQVARIAFQTT